MFCYSFMTSQLIAFALACLAFQQWAMLQALNHQVMGLHTALPIPAMLIAAFPNLVAKLEVMLNLFQDMTSLMGMQVMGRYFLQLPRETCLLLRQHQTTAA